MTSLSRNIDNWRKIDANPTVISWLQNGIKIKFHREPVTYEFQNRVDKCNNNFVNSEICKLLANGSISGTKNKPFCVSALSVVKKKGKKLRLVTDLSPLNDNIVCPDFKNEGIDNVCNLINKDDLMITVDLKDGFHHIPVHDDYRSFLGFKWKNKYYVWNVLPFGLNVSPYFFNKTVRCVTQFLRTNNIRINFWVDDGLLLAQPALIEDHKTFFITTLEELGFSINYPKSSITPENTKEYIGYTIHSTGPDNVPWIKIPNKRTKKLKRDIIRLLKQKTVHARAVARVCGQCVSFSKAILPTKLLLRNLYRLLKTKASWNSHITLDPSSIIDLKWWVSAIDSWNGRPIVKHSIEKHIFTDASSTGWGAICEDKEASGLWTPKLSASHSNVRELMAVLMALKSFKTFLIDKQIQISSDNIVTVAYLNNLGGPCPELVKIAKAIWVEAHSSKITIQAKWIAGIQNGLADRLSRLSPFSTYSWSIHPALFRLLDRMWGPHSFDRFADVTNHLCPLYNSLYHDPNSAGVDALAQQDWGQHNNFVNGPFWLIPKILQIVIDQKADATIIAPMWKAQPWFNILLKLSIAPPLHLPKSSMTIYGNKPEPLKNRRWRILAWRISGRNN